MSAYPHIKGDIEVFYSYDCFLPLCYALEGCVLDQIRSPHEDGLSRFIVTVNHLSLPFCLTTAQDSGVPFTMTDPITKY